MPIEAIESAEYQSLRAYLEAQEQRRRPAVDPVLDPPTFEHWNDIPNGLKTAGQWMRHGRKLNDGQPAVAKVIIRTDRHTDDPLFIDDDRGQSSVHPQYAMLYRENQTRHYVPSPRTKAYWAFMDVFLVGANRKDHIHRSISSGVESDEWTTFRVNGISGQCHDFRLLGNSQIRSHINHRRVIGVKNMTGKTRFLAIDLDLHGRNREVFLDQAKALLQLYHGDSWHYQIADNDASGIHFIQVFSVPRDLDESVTHLRRQLKNLDQQFPELRNRALQAGMKSIADLEVYPDRNQGFRLPLAHGRVLLLDRVLPAMVHKGRSVGDVEAYVKWLCDQDRKHLPRKEVLAYLEAHLEQPNGDSAGKSPREKKPKRSIVPGAKWKKNQRALLKDFWVEGESHGISLNEHIAVVARTAWAMGQNEDHTVESLKKMVRELPAAAKTASSRLCKGEYRKIDKVVELTVNKVFAGNNNQKNGAASTKILKKVADHYRKIQFDPLNPQSWNEAANQAPVLHFNWTESVKTRVLADLKTVLSIKGDDEVISFVEGVVALARRMNGRQWGHQYFHAWCQAEHPSVRLGFRTKRFLVLKALQQLQILRLKNKGSKRTGCSEWELGDLAELLINQQKQERLVNDSLSEEDLGPGRLLQGVKAHPSATFHGSICSSSLEEAASGAMPAVLYKGDV